jgi:solute:Na+ symporter, SSS family
MKPVGMHVVDWCIVVGLLLCWTVTIFAVRRYTRSVADYLAASRCAGRYLITVSGSTLTLGAFTFIGFFEAYYKAGFPAAWWQLIMTVQFAIVSISGWVAYRFRQTRAMTLAQFLEVRYSRKLRIFAGIVAWLSGIVNFGVFPAVGARFLIHFCGLPDSTLVFALIMAFLLGFGLLFTFLGGQIAILLTDFIQGFFSNLVILIIVFFLLHTLSWSRIVEGLSFTPSGQSLVNPFDAAKMEDFNLWFFLIIALMSAYGGCAWQSAQGFGVCALNAHEARMAGVLATWRVPGLYLTILLIAACAYTMMHHPAYAPLAQQAQGAISTIPNLEVQRQMTTPIAMTLLIPPGLMGAFVALVLGTTIGSHESFLQSWGSVFVQDVILPLRSRPLAPKQHLRLLRLSSVGVGIVVFLFSFLFRQTEYLHMFFVISYAIFTSGAGAVVIGGLYWKRGTTAGAWAAILAGALLSIAAVVVRQIENTTHVFTDPAHQGNWLYYLLGKIASRNPAVLSLSVAAIACAAYVLVSLLYRRSLFNLDRMLHRGQYVVPEHEGASAVAPIQGWRSWIGMGHEFTRSDRIVYLSSLAFTTLLIAVFLIGTLYNLAVKVPTGSWVGFWSFYTAIILTISVIITLWYTVGGVYDLRRMLHLLAQIKRNPLDDGMVVDHQNRDERPGDLRSESQSETLRGVGQKPDRR